jgi:hypothetical protein
MREAEDRIILESIFYYVARARRMDSMHAQMRWIHNGIARLFQQRIT